MRAPSPNWRHRLRQLGRGRLSVLIVATVALACSGVAVAGDLPVLSERPQQRPETPPKKAKNAEEKLTDSISALLDRVKKEQQRAIASAKRKRRAKTAEFVFSMSVDQGSTYRSVLTFPINSDDVDDFDQISSKIIKRDLATGTETELYKSRSTLAVGVTARNGHIVSQIIRIAPFSKRSYDLQSSILSARSTDTTMRIVQSRSAKITEGDGEICGEMQLVSSMSMQGEAVVYQFNTDCKTQSYESGFVGLKADGSTRDLVPRGQGGELFSGLLLSGDLLLKIDRIDGTFETKNLATGETKRLWSGRLAAMDLFEDGSVAVASEELGDFDEFPPPSNSERVSSRAKPAPAKIVVFPQGDSDAPTLNTLPRRNVETLKFCGSRLYAVRSKLEHRDEDEVDEGLPFLDLNSNLSSYEILLLTSSGVTEKSLLTTKRVLPSDVTCNGERLVIGTNNFKRTGVIEVGP